MALPGQVVRATQEELNEHPCEGMWQDGCGKPSTIKQVGETDSFGSEYWFYCQECFDKGKKHEEENQHLETCETCGLPDQKIKPYRDPDEGMSGPVYYACSTCIKKHMAYYESDNPSFRDQDELDDDLDDHGPWTSDERDWEVQEDGQSDSNPKGEE